MWRCLLILALGCGVEQPSEIDAPTPEAGDLRSDLTLTAEDVTWGGEAVYSVSGAEPGATVYFLLSTVGEGDGDCPVAAAPDLCLGILSPTKALGSAVADDFGVAEVVVPIPDLCAVGRTAYVQAGALVPEPMLTNVQANVVDGAPMAMDDALYRTSEDVALDMPIEFGVLRNDTDCGGDEGGLRSVLSRSPSNGALALNVDGSFVYTPDPDYAGVDTFSYTAVDNGNVSAPVTVTITVEAVNDAPVAVADDYIAVADTPLEIAAPGVLGNDFDIEGAALAVVVGADPRNGTLVLNVDGSFAYTPDVGFVGEDSFTYRATDGGIVSDETVVSITVE